MSTTQSLYKSYVIEEYHLREEPYYVPVGDEVELFEAAYKQRLPLIFKGPTGCGKPGLLSIWLINWELN